MQFEILKPYFLILVPVFIGIVLLILKYSPVKQYKRLRKTTILRCAILLFLILALCQPRLKWTSDSVTTVYLVDVSDSAKFYKEEAQKFISDAIKEMPSNESAGVVTFGADTKLEQFVTDKKVFDKLSAMPNQTATNIEEGVSTAMALFGADQAKRIVLITDGYENEGSAENMASSIRSQKVELKVVQIENTNEDEVYVSNLELPEKIHIGDTFTLNVEVTSNVSGSATLYLYSGRSLKGQEEVQLQKGVNTFVFKDTQTEGGVKNYRVVIEPSQDTLTVNNEYSAYTTIEARPKIMLIEGKAEEGNELAKIFEAANLAFDKVTPSGAPSNINQMLEYKSIVLLNVHGDDLPEGFMGAIDPFVKDYGGGIVAVGGEDSFALGNYRNTPLETVLPVYMDLQGEKEIPKMAIALVIDHSGSMTGGNEHTTKLDLAKEAAIESLDTLRDTDEIGILSFDDTFTWVSKLAVADDREQIEDNILSIGPGGGTSIYPAVDEAVKALSESDAKLKHIILLTDGQDGFGDYEDVLERMNEGNITLSTVSVGEDADLNILEYLAQAGGGRTYHTDITTNIPRIFAKEIFLSVKSYIINEEFTPLVTSSHEILKGVGQDGLPPLLGYVASTKKETATTVLMSPREDPILTVWQYGLGKTVAFNSDGENRWTANYAGWDKYPDFWKNIVEWTFSDVEDEVCYVTTSQDGSRGTVNYFTKEFSTDSQVTAVYTDEAGNTGEIQLNPVAPGEFSGDIPVDQTGVYAINVRQSEKGEVSHNVNTAVAMQYSREYRVYDDVNVLGSLVDSTGGTFIQTPEEVYSGDPEPVSSQKSLSTPLVILALILFIFDLCDRRLHFKFNWLRKKAGLAKERINPSKEAAKVEKKQKDKEESFEKTEKIKTPTVKNEKNMKKDIEKPVKKGDNKKIEKIDTSALLERKKEREQRK